MTKNGTAIAWLLETHPSVQTVYFPSSKCFYEQCRRKKSPISEEGGYGFLLTIKFFSAQHAVTFFDALEVARGPSLGTNFTLSCPTTIMAHANELDWVAEFGVDESFVRISAGIEDTAMLLRVVEKALKAVDNAGS
jgi:cystathionine gamma-synthase